MTDTNARIEEALAALTLEEKVRLLTGRDFWNTWPIEKIGLRAMLFSDGPSGVRGERWDEREPSVNLPSATALGASFDVDLARRYGAVAAVEARRKGVDAVLGPTINLHRSPLGGRHFEAYSEDPVLTADLAAAFVHGLQDNGVGATPKHYIANDYEDERFTASSEVDDRALRELYLLAFEKAIVEARAWLVMSSYNSINGVTATENELLETPLNSEWGFDGVVISDWTAVRSLEAAKASQDLAMPGPVGPWGDALVAAVREGKIDEAHVDRKVRRILLLAVRVGALDGFGAKEPVLVEDGAAFAREAAADGIVLLENRAALPWDADAITSVAVIGDNAAHARTQGGGSATVLPAYTISPLDGLRSALPHATVDYALGAIVQTGLSPLPADRIQNPVTGGPGVRVRFLDAAGQELFGEDRLTTSLVWFGGDAPIAEAASVELTTRFTPAEDSTVRLGFATVGAGIVSMDGERIVEADLHPVGDDLGAAFLNPPSATRPVVFVEGRPVDISFELDLTGRVDFLSGALSFQFGTEPEDIDPDALIAEAVAAARSADVALVVVGTNAVVESEGWDRTSLSLPGRQDDLVRAVAAVNPRTVVLVNSGSPVVMPWRHEVAAVLIGWFGGQEFGGAVADVLTGLREPGGRLPTTWGADEAGVPILDTRPKDGVVEYREGIHIGYRAWLRQPTVPPAYWFGAGLSYTHIPLVRLDAPATAAPGETMTVSVGVQNRSDRDGKQVVLVFAEKPGSVTDRPARWLVGFAVVRVPAGGSAVADVTVPVRLLAYWDAGWQYETGEYLLRAGTTAVDLPLSTKLMLR
ncbi:beta-glucosidase family protein [Paractinoplanes toevensis]|uniref:Glycosyl hydrolase n=1 Tax=Paractinoplanes toevensis TaxID=571911 RepID=A0A919T654_9ACTN|nr:glycoside hydrolase family 3 C-terminal domain-containing protein [Actinoplanes toevensis]GIM90084.1 glycosyl hydrolase [Actinoplanes toevensis]